MPIFVVYCKQSESLQMGVIECRLVMRIMYLDRKF